MEKTVVDELKSLVAALRERADQAEAEKKKYGEELAETKAAIEKINDRIDELQTKLQRPPTGGDEEAAGASPETKAAFINFLRTGQVAPEARKALVEDTTGEILVPEDLETEIRRELPKVTIVRQLAPARPISTNRMRLRSINAVTVGWGQLETGSTLTESTLVPTEEYAYVEDLYGLTKVGEDELMDADVALEALIRDAFRDAIAAAEDTAFIAGTGHANKQPQGVLGATGVAILAGSVQAAVSADDLVNLQYQVKDQYRARGVYIVNPDTERLLRLLKDSNGLPLWQPSLAADRPATFAGKPLYTNDAVPAISGVTGQVDDVALFGAWNPGYVIRDRLGLTIKRLDELYSEQGLVGFKIHYRVLGAPVFPAAFAKLQVTS